jgi:hypothetical protein
MLRLTLVPCGLGSPTIPGNMPPNDYGSSLRAPVEVCLYSLMLHTAGFLVDAAAQLLSSNMAMVVAVLNADVLNMPRVESA